MIIDKNISLCDTSEQEALYEMQINPKLEDEIYEIVKSFQKLKPEEISKNCYTLKEASIISRINRNRMSELFQTGILVGMKPGPKTLLIYKESLSWYLKKMYNYQSKGEINDKKEPQSKC